MYLEPCVRYQFTSPIEANVTNWAFKNTEICSRSYFVNLVYYMFAIIKPTAEKQSQATQVLKMLSAVFWSRCRCCHLFLFGHSVIRALCFRAGGVALVVLGKEQLFSP